MQNDLRAPTARRALAIVPAAALLALVVALCFVPFLTEERVVIASTPGAPPLFEPGEVVLGGGRPREVCISSLTLDQYSEAVRFTAFPARPPQAVTVTVTAPGLRDVRRTAVRGQGILEVPVRAPTRAVDGRVCLRSDSPHRLGLAASTERRSQTRAVSKHADRRARGDVVLQLVERRPATLIARTGNLIDHAATFRPAIVTPALLWALAILLAAGLPVLAFATLAIEAREGEPESGKLDGDEPAEKQGRDWQPGPTRQR